MTGHLHLVLAERAGRTAIAEQSFRAPVHLSRPYWDGRFLVVNVVNPTAGLFPGDEVRMRIQARPGASAVVTSPSANRIHRARRGETGDAVTTQEIHVAAGAELEVFPELLIPQGGSRLAQRVEIDVEAGGALMYWELLAPGRVASGEAFAFERLALRSSLRLGGRVLAREVAAFSEEELRAYRRLFPCPYYASCFVVWPEAAGGRAVREFVAGLAQETVCAAASQLSPQAAVIKVMAADSVALRTAVGAIRRWLYESPGGVMPSLRKV